MAEKYLALDHEASLTSSIGPASPSLSYSDVTLRRAFIVWAHCGAAIQFRHVCGYYQRLERLESTYPVARKALSRHLELSLLSGRPPTSSFLEEAFPNLYKKGKLHAALSKIRGVRNEQFIFHLQGFENIEVAGSSKEDIVNASRMVRRFCSEHQVTPTAFLVIFKTYLKVCNLVYSVNNLLVYLKKQTAKAEMELKSNMPKDYDFLHFDDENEDKVKKVDENYDKKASEETKTIKCEELKNKIEYTVSQNKENEIELVTEKLTYLQVTQNKNILNGLESKRLKNVDANTINDDISKIVKINSQNSTFPLGEINTNVNDDKQNKIDPKLSGDCVQITILRRNERPNVLKSDFDETYNNVVTMKARTLLFS